MSALQIIADWKVEAKNDHDIESFVPFSMMDRIIDGRRSIIAGRKGTGKTAIAKYLEKTHGATILNFDLVQFKAIAQFKDSIFNAKHEFLSVWTYIIMMAAAENLYRRNEFNFDTIKELSPYFDTSELNTSSKISHWTKLRFGVTAGGFGGGNVEMERAPVSIADDFRRNTSRLEQIIEAYEPRKVFVIFDEIDDDVDNLGITRERYINLVSSLVRASLNVSSGRLSSYVYPIICLRDDLLHAVGEEKTKWSDAIYNLTWSDAKIEAMLTKKLSIALGGEVGTLGELWGKVYDGPQIRTGSGKRLGGLDYIKRYTQNRPRDYIFFIRQAARISIDADGSLIDGYGITESIGYFSDFMHDEANSELKMIFPEWELILPIISDIGKPLFKMSDFVTLYDRASRNVSNRSTPHRVLMTMYKFSILGNTYNNIPRYRYQESSSAYRLTPVLSVHPSLHKALGIQ